MLLRLKPQATPSSKLLSKLFRVHRVTLDELPLSEYLTAKRAASLLEIDQDQILSYVAASNMVHGFVYKEQLRIHPKGVLARLRNKFRKALKSQIKEIEALLEQIRRTH
mgnify:CR=1 FL=1